MTVTTVLIANRGEIARRIIRSCQDLGLTTVAVYSDPDRLEPHAREADVAVPLGGSTPTESYLDVGKLLRAAELAGADAIHPGYGFIAENPDAAERFVSAGYTWVGPTPTAIRAMASKSEAKARVAAAGVRLPPSGPVGGDDPDVWERVADAVGYPLLVKASAGGGGKGMRRVDRTADVADAVRAARREASSSFGDPTVFFERLVVGARHVEVQIAADHHGALIHLFDRDCSVQRRHQKIVEEAPAPGLPDGLRRALHEAALAAARTVDYTNFGTVEFLVRDDEFFFLEMNTRLQVEHPVTEAVTGLDLVALQLQIAAGRPLGIAQDDVVCRGHAVEVRLCAEDPAADFLPSTGPVLHFRRPAAAALRVDSGIESGSQVTPFYDPLLAKIISHGPDRAQALTAMARALGELELDGITTNRNALQAIVRHPAFMAGAVPTEFLTDQPGVLAGGPPLDVLRLHALAATLVERQRVARTVAEHGIAAPGWRNVAGLPPARTYVVADPAGGNPGTEISVVAPPAAPTGSFALIDDRRFDYDAGPVDADGVDLLVDGLRRRFRVRGAGSGFWVNGAGWQSALQERLEFDDAERAVADAGPIAPLPGTVVAVNVAPGETVEAGTVLLIIEAMKMEHRVVAAADGIVGEVYVKAGQQVEAHQLLLEIEEG